MLALINFTDSSAMCDQNTLADLMWNRPFSVNGFFEEASFHQVTFPADTNGDGAPDIFGPISVSISKTSEFNSDKWVEQIQNTLSLAGVPLSLYDKFIFVLPEESTFYYSGLTFDCGSSKCTFIRGDVCSVVDLYMHELGHTFGLKHAASYINGLFNEYGDYSCPMGDFYIGYRHFNALHNLQAGWIPNSRLVDVQQSGTYIIYSSDKEPSATSTTSVTPQLLRIPRNQYGDWLYLSYRTPAGNYTSGLRPQYTFKTNVHLIDSTNRTVLVGTTGDNEEYFDQENNIRVIQRSHSDDYAVVEVTIGATGNCVPHEPSIAQAEPEGPYVTGDSLSTDFVLTNNDQNCRRTRFSLARCDYSYDGSCVLPLSQPPASLYSIINSSSTLEAGQSNNHHLYVDGSLFGIFADGHRQEHILISDTDGNWPNHSPTVVTVNFTVDRRGPYWLTNPPDFRNLRAKSDKIGALLAVSLSWARADDRPAGLAGYIVKRNGEVVSFTTTTKFSETIDPNNFTGKFVTYQIAATDRAGNQTPSNEVRVEIVRSPIRLR